MPVYDIVWGAKRKGESSVTLQAPGSMLGYQRKTLWRRGAHLSVILSANHVLLPPQFLTDHLHHVPIMSRAPDLLVTAAWTRGGHLAQDGLIQSLTLLRTQTKLNQTTCQERSHGMEKVIWDPG